MGKHLAQSPKKEARGALAVAMKFALFLAAVSTRAAGLALLSNATGRSQRGFLSSGSSDLPPMTGGTITEDGGASNLGEAKDCRCGACVSAWRKRPTAVSDTKCVPARSMPIGLTCNPKGKFPAVTYQSDVPYQ